MPCYAGNACPRGPDAVKPHISRRRPFLGKRTQWCVDWGHGVRNFRYSLREIFDLMVRTP